jgi:hypothetical protein
MLAEVWAVYQSDRGESLVRAAFATPAEADSAPGVDA